MWIVVGFASAYGLRWLDERTQGQSVHLLIGDTRKGFNHWNDADRDGALRFIARPDVQISNWYTKHGGGAMAHAKAWMAFTPNDAMEPQGVLVGSANLTKKGLHENQELVANASTTEHKILRANMMLLFERSWELKPRLLQLLGVAEDAAAAHLAQAR